MSISCILLTWPKITGRSSVDAVSKISQRVLLPEKKSCTNSFWREWGVKCEQWKIQPQTKENHWTGFTSVCHGGASAGIMECTECVHHSLEVHRDSATCPPTWATEELTYLGRTPGWSESRWWGLRDRAGLSCSPAGCFELSSSRSKFWWDKTCPYFMSVWVGPTEVNRSDASLFSNVFDSSVGSKIKQKALFWRRKGKIKQMLSLFCSTDTVMTESSQYYTCYFAFANQGHFE